MPLTDLKCKSAKPESKQRKLGDSGGLFLLIHPNGSKYWRLKYRIGGKEKLLALGVYPEISLLDARLARDAAKKLIREGIDPNEQKKREKQRTIIHSANTFEIVAREWHEVQKAGWTSHYAGDVMRRLEVDIFPYIGSWPIADIEAPALLDVLRKIERRGATELSNRVKQVCGQVFRFGIQTGRCKRNPAADLTGALKPHKTKHYAAIEAKELPELLAALDNNTARLYPRTIRAIKLSLLTFTRPTELREARWQEIDFEEALWTIPAERMKMKRDHIVPLSKQAIAVLRSQEEETSLLKTDWVFPSVVRPRNAISNNTVNVALKKLGYHGRMTAHGFRALARTTIHEKLRYNPEVIERQLAHKASGPLGEAYDRTQFIEDRIKMMQDWADYIDSLES